MKNNKGFTLIELLAVIVLVGMLLSVAVVAISKYIENSKLKLYVDIAKQYIEIASIEIAKQDIVARDKNTVYYIHISNLQAEKDIEKSPFGEWIDAYVVVVIDADTGDYHYYWTSVDEAGYRVDETLDADLSVNSIYVTNDLTINPTYPIGGRDKVTIYDKDGNKESTEPQVEMKEEEAVDCFTYIIEDNGIAITDYNRSCGTDVVIPSTIDDVPVYRIAMGAFKNKNIKNVTVYKGVEKIEYGAFQGNNINTVKLSISVKRVEDYAFYNSKIKNLVMPEGVTYIGTFAFANNNICSVELPSSLTYIGSWAFANNCLTEVDLPAGVSISGGTFSNNDISDSSAFIYKKNSDGTADYSTIVGYAGNKTNNIVIPATKNGVALTRIESSAFNSVGITGTLVIPDTVTYLGSDAFAFNSITSVVLPSNLKTIKSGAFRSNKLTSIDIPDSVTSIDATAFNTNEIYGEEGIIYARTTSGVDYGHIVGYAGGKTNGTLTVPATKNGVKLYKISGSAFAGCNLTDIKLPDISQTNNLTIGTNAFVRNKVVASSSSAYNTGGFFCKVNNGVIDCSTITSYAGVTSGTITIPDTINGKTVKRISAAFTWMSYSKIVLPSYSDLVLDNGIFAKSARNNQNLKTIVNRTGKAYAWNKLTSTSITDNNTFVTGTITHEAGNISVVSE